MSVLAAPRPSRKPRQKTEAPSVASPSTIGGAPERLPLGRRLATLALLAGLMVALVMAVPGLRGVAHEARHINGGSLLAAIALEFASAISFVVVFRRFFDRLGHRDARDLAWTEQATGALLPGGGVGGFAIGAWLMRQTGMSTEWVIRRSGGLFFLNSASNALSVIVAGTALMLGASGSHGFLLVTLPTVAVVVLTAAVVISAHLLGERDSTPSWVRAAAGGVRDAERSAFREAHWRLLGTLGYLGFDMAVLWVTLRALGPAPSVPALVLAYNIGYLANTLPIPAGIGVLDAGLAGALVVYGVAPQQAAAGVLIYHAIALWIPGLGGSLAYLRLRARLFAPTPRSQVFTSLQTADLESS